MGNDKPDEVVVLVNGVPQLQMTIPQGMTGKVTMNVQRDEIEFVQEFNGLETKTRCKRGEAR